MRYTLTRLFVLPLLVLAAGCRKADERPGDPGDPSASAHGVVAAESAARPPSTDDAGAAVAVVREYYDAIRAQDYRRAYAFWSDSGRGSGQSFDAFRRGFAETASVELTVGTPSRVEGAAGSRYVDVPVEVTAAQRDGAVRRFRGQYTLRRAVVPGATDAERRWHLYAARVAPVD